MRATTLLSFWLLLPLNLLASSNPDTACVQFSPPPYLAQPVDGLTVAPTPEARKAAKTNDAQRREELREVCRKRPRISPDPSGTQTAKPKWGWLALIWVLFLGIGGFLFWLLVRGFLISGSLAIKILAVLGMVYVVFFVLLILLFVTIMWGNQYQPPHQPISDQEQRRIDEAIERDAVPLRQDLSPE